MANTTVKKHGGREKVTPNKLPKELRSVLKVVILKFILIMLTRVVID